MNERKLELFSIKLQYFRAVAENEDFVIKCAMFFYQILKNFKFSRICCVQQLATIKSIIVLHKFIGHLA